MTDPRVSVNFAEVELIDMMVDLFGSSNFSLSQRAQTFATYIVPNKEFANHAAIVQMADVLADELEGEISKLKGSTSPDRDERLVQARQHKKDLKGFVTHANKLPDC